MDQQQLSAQSMQQYMPAVALTRATLKHSLPKVPVSVWNAPERICGTAQRVGYTGKQDDDLAIYRLKIKPADGLSTITLPNFYVIDQGIFIEYDLWTRQR